MLENAIENRLIASLKPWKTNARIHSKKQIGQIAASIKEFGFTNPVLIDDAGNILAGHGRVRAASTLGWTEVPCICLSHMSTAQKRAYVLADNKIALNSGWDEDLLGEELKALLDLEIDFDVQLTGFSIPEIDMLVDSIEPEEDGNPVDDHIPRHDEVSLRCTVGQIWQLGPHRLICGDALDSKVIAALMAGEKAEMIFTDPPYNVRIEGNVGGKGAIKHREFEMASGEMSRAEFTNFLRRACQNQAAVSKDGSIHFVCMDWRHMRELLDASDGVYQDLKNVITWVKDNGGMGTFYRSRHELIFAFKKGTAPHINTFELGQHGRYRTNVWSYKGMNSFGAGRLDDLAMHPTMKPVQMIADAIRDVSGRGGIVLDLFGGSGSTLIAAHKTGRRAYLCEIDPHYCNVIINRWERFANDEAVLIEAEVMEAGNV
tara:strand:- start:7117 stop:8409 length:1293 start_codon:yes stop_codon:yes gene_type:complete